MDVAIQGICHWIAAYRQNEEGYRDVETWRCMEMIWEAGAHQSYQLGTLRIRMEGFGEHSKYLILR